MKLIHRVGLAALAVGTVVASPAIAQGRDTTLVREFLAERTPA